MAISNITLNSGVRPQNSILTTVQQNTVNTNNSQPANLQRKPQEDNFNGKSLDKKKVITDTAFAVLLAVGLDFCFAKGKHVKNLWEKLVGKTKEVKPDAKPKADPDIKPAGKQKTNPKSDPDIKPEGKSEPEPKPEVNQEAKPRPIKEPITEKEYIDSETLSPVKEKWQGDTLLEKTIKTKDGLVTKSYKNGKIESMFVRDTLKGKNYLFNYRADGTIQQKTKLSGNDICVYHPDGQTLKMYINSVDGLNNALYDVKGEQIAKLRIYAEGLPDIVYLKPTSDGVLKLRQHVDDFSNKSFDLLCANGKTRKLFIEKDNGKIHYVISGKDRNSSIVADIDKHSKKYFVNIKGTQVAEFNPVTDEVNIAAASNVSEEQVRKVIAEAQETMKLFKKYYRVPVEIRQAYKLKNSTIRKVVLPSIKE